MDNISDHSRSMVKTAKVCAELLLQLINNLLDIGKFEIGKLEVNMTQSRVHHLFQQLWIISTEVITRKGLSCHLKIAKNVPPIIEIDEHRLNQVMLNLIGNAVKFTDHGSVSITVQWLQGVPLTERCYEPLPFDETNEGAFEKNENMFRLNLSSREKNVQENSNHLILTKYQKEFDLARISFSSQSSLGVLKIIVKDTGCGMSQSGMDRLFQKFSQVSSDPRQRQVGTGLGLFITKEICKKMGGDVRVFSKPSAGSAFIVLLPTKCVPSCSPPRTYSTLETMIDKLITKRLRAVVSDDSPFNVSMMCSFLAKLNVKPICTVDGQDALENYIRSVEGGNSIDVVTLDVDMPRMNGIIACQKIRQYERERGLRPATVILISGNYDEQQMQACLGKSDQRKADCFLKKPLLFEGFLNTLYRLKVEDVE